MVLVVLYIALLFALINSFSECIPHPIQDADNSTKCAFSFVPTGYLAVGKSISVPGDCSLVTCQEDRTIKGLTCPTYFLFPGCVLTPVDYYKEYPDCCPQMFCNVYEYGADDYQYKRKRQAKWPSSRKDLFYWR